MAIGSVTTRPSYWILLAPIVSLALVWFRIIHLGPPEVFADEYSYALWARHFFDGSLPPSGVAINNWLYLRAMSLTFLLPGDITQCARIVNAFVVALSAVPVSLIVVRRASVPLAVLSGLLYAVCCAGNAAAYFMPDAMFFTAFAFACLLLIRFIEKPGIERLIVLAAWFAAMSLIKIHAIFLLPSLLVAILATMGLKRDSWRSGIGYCLVFVVVALATNVGLSFALTFHFSFNILGGFYGGLASDSTHGISWHQFAVAAHVAGHHLIVLLPLALVPIIFIGLAAAQGWRARFAQPTDELDWALFGVFAVLTLAALLCVTALFTATVAGPTYHSTDSLHGRYYEQVATLVIFIGWASAVRLSLRLAIPFAVLGCILTVAGIRFINHHGWHSPVDYSIVYTAFAGGRGLHFFIAFAVCSLFAILLPWRGPRYLMVLAGSLYFFFNAYALDGLRNGVQPTDEDTIPVPGDARAKVVIVAHQLDANVYRAGYTLMARNITSLIADDPRCKDLPSGTYAIVSLQNIGPVCGFVPQYSSGRVWVGLRPSSVPLTSP